MANGKPAPIESATGRASAIVKAATAPSFIICGASPLFAPLFAGLGLAGLGFVLHRALWVFAPLNLLILIRGFRRHRNPWPVTLGGLGTASVWIHLFAHTADRTILPLIWAGTLLLIAGALLDRRAEGKLRDQPMTQEAVSNYWSAVLRGTHPGLRRGRRLYAILPGEPRCRLCNAPFSGAGAVLARLMGKSPSGKNPNFCADCLVRTPIGGAEIELSMLFADIRGSTSIAENCSPSDFAALLNRFYEAATRVMLTGDALVDRFVGDEAIGLFVPGYAGSQHARRAIHTAWDLLIATGHASEEGPWAPVGAGVHTGVAFVGVVGSDAGVTEMTALGDPVNTTARLAQEAGPGEILVSEDSCRHAGIETSRFEARRLQLKGRSEELSVRVISVNAETPKQKGGIAQALSMSTPAPSS